MRVLIACEFSGIVRDAFAARGHEWANEIAGEFLGHFHYAQAMASGVQS